MCVRATCVSQHCDHVKSIFSLSDKFYLLSHYFSPLSTVVLGVFGFMLEAQQFPCCSHYCDSKILILEPFRWSSQPPPRVIIQLLSESLFQNVRSLCLPWRQIQEGARGWLTVRKLCKSKDNLLNDSSQLAGSKSDMLGGIFSVDLRGIELGGGIFLAPSCGDDSFY